MDERLEKALDFSNYMITLGNQRRALEEKFLASCVYYQNGGKFTITKELVSFTKLLLDQGKTACAVIDDNNLPVEVADISKFFEEIFNLYTNAVETYLSEYTKLKQNRSIESILK